MTIKEAVELYNGVKNKISVLRSLKYDMEAAISNSPPGLAFVNLRFQKKDVAELKYVIVSQIDEYEKILQEEFKEEA